VKHGLLLVVVAAAAIVVGGLAGCSDNKSTTSSSTTTRSTTSSSTTTRSTTSSPTTTRSSAGSSSPTRSTAAGPAPYKIIVNGRDINAPEGRFSDVGCGLQRTNEGNNVFNITVRGGVAELDPEQSKVLSVGLHDSGTNVWWMGQGGANGNASLTKSGNSIKITGNVSLMSDPTRNPKPIGSPVPFEFDVTCP